MRFLKMICAFLALVINSCSQQPSNSEPQIRTDQGQHMAQKSGLSFVHGGYRGTTYTDSHGTVYNLRNNPVTITNDSTVAIQIQITFAQEYDYPPGNGDEKFRVFPLPKTWAQEGTTDSEFDSMRITLPKLIDQPFLNDTLAPGEKLALAIGTIYPRPAEKWSVVPNELFAKSDGVSLPVCDWLKDEEPSVSPADIGSDGALGLRLVFTQSCMIIPCGQISYLIE